VTDDASQRLAKVVAALVPCSRSQAEQYIAEGWVRVDGERVEEPQHRVTARQRVDIDRNARLQPLLPVTVLVHKPAGMGMAEAQALIGAASHWEGDVSGIRRIKGHSVGLVALLPLPDEASGLAVFSQDRGVVRKLTQDAALVEQELLADVAGTIAAGGLELMAHGLVRDGHSLPAARVSWQSETRLRIAAKGIAPQLVPWMCAQVGLQLTALRRLRIGRVPLGGLPSGQWRYLPAHERF
jgi:23S rRNA pseudouridine2604 synthase